MQLAWKSELVGKPRQPEICLCWRKAEIFEILGCFGGVLGRFKGCGLCRKVLAKCARSNCLRKEILTSSNNLMKIAHNNDL